MKGAFFFCFEPRDVKCAQDALKLEVNFPLKCLRCLYSAFICKLRVSVVNAYWYEQAQTY